MTTHWKNVALVNIVYLWRDGTLKLVSKTPQLHQGTLLGAVVTADAYPIPQQGKGAALLPANLQGC